MVNGFGESWCRDVYLRLLLGHKTERDTWRTGRWANQPSKGRKTSNVSNMTIYKTSLLWLWKGGKSKGTGPVPKRGTSTRGIRPASWLMRLACYASHPLINPHGTTWLTRSRLARRCPLPRPRTRRRHAAVTVAAQGSGCASQLPAHLGEPSLSLASVSVSGQT